MPWSSPTGWNNRGWNRAASGGGGGPTTLNPSTTPAPGTTAGITISGGGLVAGGLASSYGRAGSLGTAPAGQLVYAELTITNLGAGGGAAISFGVMNASKDQGPGAQSWVGGSDHNSCGITDDGTIFRPDGTNINDAANLTFSTSMVLGMELDNINGLLRFRKGSYPGGYLSAQIPVPAGLLYVFIGLGDPAAVGTLNAGASALAYTPSPGYTGVFS